MNAMDLDADLDARLVEAARRGSDAAFERIVARYQKPVRSFLRRIGDDASDADDLAQETFVAAWSTLGRYRGPASLRAWLCGIAYRKHLSRFRSDVRARARESRFAEAGEACSDDLAGDRLDLARAMTALPVDQRAAVSLCLAADFSHAEASEALGLPLGTVKSHVTRGRARLLEALTWEEGQDDRP
jgi:RNA polymerase sigma factor (sigma-70 family)